MNKTIFTDKTYLSEVMEYLPSGVLLNKGITGCGGTYVELNSKRDSLILVPTIELAKNKEQPNSLIVYGKVTKKQIEEYIYSDIKYKKIIGTYDSLLRMIDFPEITNYFLLIDEYHVLFNSYAFRNKAILNILKTYKLFKDFCFMTATPLNDDIILNEIKDLPKIDIVWEKAIPVKLNVVDVNFTTKELLKIISKKEDVNYHIFLNSVKTIKEIIPKLDEYKVVCSQEKIRSLEVSSTKDPVKRFNFYTSAAFEGCILPKNKVLTNSGLKNVEDITLEDMLINKNGEEVSIINLQRYEKFNEDTFTITLGNTFRTTSFTGIHPILVSDHPLKSPFNFIECAKIKSGQWVVYPNVYNKEKILDNYEWDKFESMSDKEIINPINEKDFWWFVGLYLGDGWTQNDGYRVFITINNKETRTIEKLNSFCKLINRSYRIKETSSNCKEYIINSKQLVDFLNSNFGKYAKGKYIPENFKYINKDLKKELLNGYLDSDGCILFSNGSYRATMVSINLKLLEDIQDIYSSLGIKSSLKKLRDNKKMIIEGREVNCSETYHLNISHGDLMKFYTMCSNQNYQKLNKLTYIKSCKKYPRFVSMDFSEDLKFIYFKIKDICINKYTGSVYNFECDTHTYLCRHITTHNCDINDPKGKTIILCDTKIATTILDISTLVRQICGRLRDSIYKDEVTLILNTGRHRYAGKNKETFKKEVEKNVLLGRYTELLFNSSDNPLHKEAELRKYQDDTFHSMYINKYQNEIFYDDNLRKMDEYNFELITEIYDSSISVMKSADANNFISKEIKQSESNWIVGLLKNKEYSFNELYEIFFPLFEERGLTFTAKSLKDYFPEFTKRRKSVNKIRETYYRFKI